MKFPLFLFPFLAAPVWGQIQDTAMNRTLHLERDFSPIVQQKSKIDQQPATQPLQQKKSDAALADWHPASVRSQEIGVVPAGQVIAGRKENEHGYLSLSAGNYWNTDLQAGLRAGNFSLDGRGYLTKGELELPYPVMTDEEATKQKWDSRLLRGNLSAKFSKTLFSGNQLDMHAIFSGTNINSFPYQAYNLSSDTLMNVKKQPGSQHWGKMDFGIGYETDALHLGLDYNYDKLTSPDTMGLSWNVNTILMKGTYGWYDNPNWIASIDLDLGGAFGKEVSAFIFHPSFHLSFIPNETAWRRLYLDFGAGSRYTSISQILDIMPLSTFDELPANTKDIIDLHLGYEDNDQGYLHWGTEMQLAYTEDELSGMAVLVDTTCRDGLYLQMSQKKCFRFAFDVHMDWEYTRYFGMKTRLNILSLSNQDAYLGRAKTTINLHMLSHPGKVTIDLGFDGGFGRKVSYLEETYDLGNIADLNIKLDWQISKSFKLSAWARNLLAHEYEIIPGAPAQKLNVHAGFDWRF